MTVRGTLAMILQGEAVKAVAGGDDVFRFDHTLRAELTDGAGANQANRCYKNFGTIAAGANLDLDLNGGGLLDVHGDALALTDIRAIYIRNASVSGPTLRLGGSATNRVNLFNASTDFLDLKPGAASILVYPAASDVPVTAGSADVLRLTNLGGETVSFELILLGVGA